VTLQFSRWRRCSPRFGDGWAPPTAATLCCSAASICYGACVLKS